MSMNENNIEDALRNAQASLADLSYLQRLGQLFSETVLLKIDDEFFYLHFEKGLLASIDVGESRKTPWRFAFHTDHEALLKFWQCNPEPGFHDIFGLVKIGRGRVEGDILMLVKNLRFIKEFLALPRAKEAR